MTNATIPSALTPEGVKQTRQRLGLSQEQFCQYLRRLGKRGALPTVSTVSRWERGLVEPGPLFAQVLILAAERAAAGERP